MQGSAWLGDCMHVQYRVRQTGTSHTPGMGLSADGASDSTSSKVGDTEGEAVKSEPTCCCDLVSGDIDGGLGPDPPAASGLSREITCRCV